MAQQVNLLPFFQRCPFHADHQAGSCEYQIESHRLDPTRKQIGIYSIKGRQTFYHSDLINIKLSNAASV